MRLTVRSGPQAGQDFMLPQATATIGRAVGCEVLLTDSYVSGHHAQIVQQPQGFVITDLGSQNGTLVNGQRITSPQLLREGDRIQVGQTEMAFSPALAAQPVAAAPGAIPVGVPAPVPRPGTSPWPIIAIAGGAVLLFTILTVVAVLRPATAPTSTTPVPLLTTPTITPVPSPTTSKLTPTSVPHTITPSPPPTATPVPPTATRVPPTATSVPPTPTSTPVDWANADWAVIAKLILQNAKQYLPQILEVKTALEQDQVNCPRLVELLDSLANAPQYKEADQPLWDRRKRPGIESQLPLYSFKDAYAYGVNLFTNDVFFRRMRDGCANGIQPTAQQRATALRWVEESKSKMEHVINNLGPVVGQ